MKLLIGLIITIAIVIANGCRNDLSELAQPAPVANCDTIDAITYTNFVKNLIKTTCSLNGCHDISAPPGYDYTFYAGIKAKVDNGTFENRVLKLKEMPSQLSTGARSLDACTLLKLRKWVNNGAPE